MGTQREQVAVGRALQESKIGLFRDQFSGKGNRDEVIGTRDGVFLRSVPLQQHQNPSQGLRPKIVKIL